MGRSVVARCVSLLLKLRYKPSEKQAEEDLEKLLQNGEEEPPMPEGIPARYSGRVFYINESATSNAVVFYMHGGGYQHDFSSFHWKFLKKVVKKTGAEVIAPAYRLIPFGTCRDAFELIVPLYREYACRNPEKKLILMGDSSGGGLDIALAEHFRTENIRMPDELILMSPWVDVTMENPEIADYTAKDPWLTVPWLKVCGRHWAGTYELRDYKVSPIYGDVRSMTNVTVFAGTREIFYPDILKFFNGLDQQGNSLIIGQDMNHVFPILPIPEAKKYCGTIFDIIRR